MVNSRFSSYGQKAIAEAKKNGVLLEFARNMPTPKERKKLLADGIRAKNSGIWTRYVFREAFSINEKDLGSEWVKFSEQLAISHQGASQALRKNNPKPSITKETQLS